MKWSNPNCWLRSLIDSLPLTPSYCFPFKNGEHKNMGEEEKEEKEKKKTIKMDQSSSSQEEGGDPNLHLHSWARSRNLLFISSKISPQTQTLDFTMHGWKKKVVSCSIISSVSPNPSLTQSSHGFPKFLSNWSYVVFARKS